MFNSFSEGRRGEERIFHKKTETREFTLFIYLGYEKQGGKVFQC